MSELLQSLLFKNACARSHGISKDSTDTHEQGQKEKSLADDKCGTRVELVDLT